MSGLLANLNIACLLNSDCWSEALPKPSSRKRAAQIALVMASPISLVAPMPVISMTEIMGHSIMQISSDYGAQSSERLSTKNAWALYVRRRWITGGVKAAMREWDLTEGEAKGLFAAQVSQPTIDKIIEHRRGGFALGLLILQIKTQTSISSFIEERRRHEREEYERIDRGLRKMAADLPAIFGLDAAGPR